MLGGCGKWVVELGGVATTKHRYEHCFVVASVYKRLWSGCVRIGAQSPRRPYRRVGLNEQALPTVCKATEGNMSKIIVRDHD
jgi:hypothetical protein